MRKFPLPLWLALAGGLGWPGAGRAKPLRELFAERSHSVVMVEFYTQTETSRIPHSCLGVVIDRDGLIILPGDSFNSRTPPDRFKEFKVYQLGSATPWQADYLGFDELTNWHFIRVEPKLRSQLTPVTDWIQKTAPEPAAGDDVWGISAWGKDDDFLPSLEGSQIEIVAQLPRKTALVQTRVGSPGSPIFDQQGALVGLATGWFNINIFLHLPRVPAPLPAGLQIAGQSNAFVLLDEVKPYFSRVPTNVNGRPIAWDGLYKLEPLDPEVAGFLKLGDQAGVVVSEVMDDSPAQKAGVQPRDIILSVDGRPLPRFHVKGAAVAWLERETLRRRPGEQLTLGILRDGRRLDVKLTLAENPKRIAEASREYFARIGFTAREFVQLDAVANRIKPAAAAGIVASFVKPSSPAATAGLKPGDWIREIDGAEIKTYAQAVPLLAAIEADANRDNFVLLISRAGKTSVLRVQLK